MKTTLLLFSALLPAALACESHEGAAAVAAEPASPTHVASINAKNPTDKQPAPNAPLKPAPKPGKQRPPRPEYLFL